MAFLVGGVVTMHEEIRAAEIAACEQAIQQFRVQAVQAEVTMRLATALMTAAKNRKEALERGES